MKKILTVSMFVMCFALSLSSAMADGGKCSMMRSHERQWGMGAGHQDKGLEQMFFWKAKKLIWKQEELGLTEEQVEKIKALKLKVKKAMVRQEAEIKILKMDIHAALKSDAPDGEAVNVLVDQKYDLKKEKTKQLIQAWIDLKALLTEEQKTALKNWHKTASHKAPESQTPAS